MAGHAPMTAALSPSDRRSANALRHRPVVVYWLASTAASFAVQIMSVSVGWQIYDITRNPLDLGFVGLVLAGFGVLTLLNAEDLAAGTTLARTLCFFIALFWLARLAVQFFVFDVRPYLTSRWLTVGYHATTGVFIYLAVVYAWAAWGRGLR